MELFTKNSSKRLSVNYFGEQLHLDVWQSRGFAADTSGPNLIQN